jgi:hypothetical protein
MNEFLISIASIFITWMLIKGVEEVFKFIYEFEDYARAAHFEQVKKELEKSQEKMNEFPTAKQKFMKIASEIRVHCHLTSHLTSDHPSICQIVFLHLKEKGLDPFMMNHEEIQRRYINLCKENPGTYETLEIY